MPNHIPQKELIERLKTIKAVLKENETAATPDLVEAIDTVLTIMKPSNKLMEDIDKIFSAMMGENNLYGH